MSKKLYAACLPVLAVVAFAVMPAVAQAQPHWYVCEAKAGGKYKDHDCLEKVATGGKFERKKLTATKVAVTTHGELALSNANIGVVTCTVTDAGKIWNPAGGAAGKDEITSFVNHPCSSATCPVEPEVIAEGLPWPTELLAGPRIKITGIKVRVICDSLVNTVFSGTLTPKFINKSPSYAEFDSESGTLENSEFGPGTVTGKDYVEGPEGETVLVTNP